MPNEFINATSEYSNRRKLTVESVTKNAQGEITELVVLVERIFDANESGTEINASNLTSIIQSMIDNNN